VRTRSKLRVGPKKVISLILLISFSLTNIAAISVLGKRGIASAVNNSVLLTDLTQLGRDGKLRENLNFETETARLIEVLAKGGSRQPLLLDEKGESQDLIVEQLAICVAKGHVPESLKGIIVLKLEDAVLQALTALAEGETHVEAARLVLFGDASLAAADPSLNPSDSKLRASIQPLNPPPAGTSPVLVDAAREASTDAFHLAVIVSATMLAAGAAVNGIGLREPRVRSGAAEQGAGAGATG